MQITIQPIHVGNVGQYLANGINIQALPFTDFASDTTITVQCNLINIVGSTTTQVPDPWGGFQVVVAFPLNMSRVTLGANVQTAVLAAGNPVFIIR